MQDAEGQGQEAVALCGMLLKRVAPHSSHLLLMTSQNSCLGHASNELLRAANACTGVTSVMQWSGRELRREIARRDNPRKKAPKARSAKGFA